MFLLRKCKNGQMLFLNKRYIMSALLFSINSGQRVIAMVHINSLQLCKNEINFSQNEKYSDKKLPHSKNTNFQVPDNQIIIGLLSFFIIPGLVLAYHLDLHKNTRDNDSVR